MSETNQQVTPAWVSLKDRMTSYYSQVPFSGDLVLIYPYGSETLRNVATTCMDVLESVVGKLSIRMQDNNPAIGFKNTADDRPYTIAVGADGKLYFTGVGVKNREMWDVTELAPKDWRTLVIQDMAIRTPSILKLKQA